MERFQPLIDSLQTATVNGITMRFADTAPGDLRRPAVLGIRYLKDGTSQPLHDTPPTFPSHLGLMKPRKGDRHFAVVYGAKFS